MKVRKTRILSTSHRIFSHVGKKKILFTQRFMLSQISSQVKNKRVESYFNDVLTYPEMVITLLVANGK